MSKHFLMPWNWKWEFTFDTRMGEQLFKLNHSWSIKDHDKDSKSK